jgi:hypothetical protein
MDMNENTAETPNTPVIKKPYEKPSFRFEKVFVTTALSCGKVGTSSQSCIQHPSAS